MHALIGFALSLVLGAPKPYIGPNGFDPSAVAILWSEGGRLGADDASGEFRDWLECGGAAECKRGRLLAVGYFVACAFDQQITIRVGPHDWQGELGLAPHLQATLAGLSGSAPSAQLLIEPEEGKWVSACLMAFANVAASHEYVWLRGNPPGTPLLVTPSLRWTMGYPEGVFFADLLNHNVSPTKGLRTPIASPRLPSISELEQSFTLSLNVPKGYRGLLVEGWAPPNASNGRTLDFDHVTSAGAGPFGHYHVAENLGRYLLVHQFMEPTATQADPDYPFDSVCVKAGRAVVPCSTAGAVRLRPLFVHAPRVVGLASAHKASQQNPPIQALDTGRIAIRDDQRVACTAGVDCTGAFRLHATGESPARPSDTSARHLSGLAKAQAVDVVLQFDRDKEGFELTEADLTMPFTALIRYRGKSGAVASVETSTAAGGWAPAEAKWAATGQDWEWLQVYPVYAFQEGSAMRHRPVIKVRISGNVIGKESPEFDMAGFVVGEPWCLPPGKTSYAEICVEGHHGRGSTLRLPIPRLTATVIRSPEVPKK